MKFLSIAAILAGVAATPMAARAQNGPGVTDKEIKIGNTMP